MRMMERVPRPAEILVHRHAPGHATAIRTQGSRGRLPRSHYLCSLVWLWTDNNERPNMGIGGITPAQKLAMAA